METILVEKYRPQSFEEVVGLNPEIPKHIQSGNIPHMLFVGPPGTGKTTVAKIIGKKLTAEMLILNASKERGINTIKDKIEPFATKASKNLKIVFLDEFDATTPAFQTALRNFMETHSRTTRFIATCNYPNKIIEPLKSRFTIYEFYRYNKDDIIQHLNKIIMMEGIEVEDGVLELLVTRYHDDIRGMINFLNKNRHKRILKNDVGNEDLVLKILSKCKAGEWEQLRKDLLNEYLDYSSLIEEMDKIVFNHKAIPLDVKRKMNKVFAEYDYRMHFAFSKELCFAALLNELTDLMRW